MTAWTIDPLSAAQAISSGINPNTGVGLNVFVSLMGNARDCIAVS